MIYLVTDKSLVSLIAHERLLDNHIHQQHELCNNLGN